MCLAEHCRPYRDQLPGVAMLPTCNQIGWLSREAKHQVLAGGAMGFYALQ